MATTSRRFDNVLESARDAVRGSWSDIEQVEAVTQRRVLDSFRGAGVRSHDLSGSTGYGYDDTSREKLEAVYAGAFQAEAAIVRPQITSGTHALWLCLDACLASGSRLLSVTGTPYDTLHRAIAGDSPYSLRNKGVTYSEVRLAPDGQIDLAAVAEAVSSGTTVLYVQRSKGYAWRPAVSVDEIAKLCRWRERHCPHILVIVDNCYGEFVEPAEPPGVGADLAAGSLIKNPGGTLAPAGGYIVGRSDLLARIADRITAPGLGLKVGPSLGTARPILQGLFFAPHLVSEALSGLTLAAFLFERCGLEVLPGWSGRRKDLVQAVRLDTPDRLVRFCQAVQASSPIDANVLLEPGPLPGYDDEVVMAAGTFIQGASSELSADGPLRDPYVAFMQGGISKQHVVIAVERILKDMELLESFSVG